MGDRTGRTSGGDVCVRNLMLAGTRIPGLATGTGQQMALRSLTHGLQQMFLEIQ